MKLVPADQNYWPGYLDALINVLLNLLMLVAVFAMGLVSLNLQVFTQEQQLSKLGTQWSQVVDAMLSPSAEGPDGDSATGGANKAAWGSRFGLRELNPGNTGLKPCHRPPDSLSTYAVTHFR